MLNEKAHCPWNHGWQRPEPIHGTRPTNVRTSWRLAACARSSRCTAGGTGSSGPPTSERSPNYQPGQGQGQSRGDAQRRAQTRGVGYQGRPENWRPPNQRYQDRAPAGQNPGINLNRAPPKTLGDQFASITIVAAEHSVLRVDTREHQGPIQGRLIDPFACQHPARVEMNCANNAPRTGDGARLAPLPKNGTYFTFTFFKTLGAYQLVIVGSVEYGVSQESAAYTKEISWGIEGLSRLACPCPRRTATSTPTSTSR